MITTEKIMQKAWRVLFYERVRKISHLSKQEATDLLLELQNEAILIPTTLDLKIIKQNPTDDKYIAAGIEGKADNIVSGDQHLLELIEYEGIKIVTPREFVEILETQDEK